MCNTDTRNVHDTVAQIKRLETLGCEIIRVAVPDMAAAEAIKSIVSQINIPLIADIHFNHKLAIESMLAGAAAVRINPGNIGGVANTLEVLRVAKDMDKVVRIGVNAGSLEKDLLESYGVSAHALVKSAVRQMDILEEAEFTNYKVSIKASSVPMTVEAYKLFAETYDAPLHIGVTEAGTRWMGTIKSAIGIGALLLQGIGDTIRVSLTAEPEEEIRAAWGILNACGARKRGVEIISCPTCGRTEIDLITLAEAVETACTEIDKTVTVAVMGCVVNGPGEAREADFGVAGGKGVGVLFCKGEIVKKVDEKDIMKELMKMVR
jgi:(E)-4-hydroxy-3-methylbut-2-enyl-diphosphate synthase